MEKNTKKIIAGAGILGGAGLIYLLTRRGAPPTPPPGMASLYGKVTNAETGKAIESIEVTVNGYGGSTNSYGNYQIQAITPGEYAVTFRDPLGGYETKVIEVEALEADVVKQLNVALTPVAGVKEPIAKGTINGYEVWLVGIKPEILRDLQYHEFQAPTSVHVYFEIWQPPYTEEIWITDESQMPVATLALTRPDGVVAKDTRRIPQINSGGDYSLSVSAPIPGIYYCDFCGITFSFKLLPIENEIFYPTGLELIYDSAPYCQETYNLHKNILEGDQDGYNLLAIINRAVDINITSLDLAISRFFSEANAGKFAITMYGDVKNSPNRQYHVTQAPIPLTIKLIPQELYAQAYLETGDYTYSLRHPRYWKCPDPDSKTLYYPHSGISRYYDTGDPSSTMGMKIATGATGSFQRTASGMWARGGSFRNELVHDQTWVQKLLVAGDRYEVVIISGVGLDSYLSGYNYAAYPLKYWHVGYVIIG